MPAWTSESGRIGSAAAAGAAVTSRRTSVAAAVRARIGRATVLIGTCAAPSRYGEETLDVEAVHALAPGANVLYVAGRSCDDPDLLKALDTIVSRRRAGRGGPRPSHDPGHLDGRRPAARHAGRRDADVPRRKRALLGVPDRRHEPLLAALRGPGGARRPGLTAPARVRQPGDLRAEPQPGGARRRAAEHPSGGRAGHLQERRGRPRTGPRWPCVRSTTRRSRCIWRPAGTT